MAGNLIIQALKLGESADTSKNFLIEVPTTPDGTLTIKRENGTQVLKIDATGAVHSDKNKIAFAAYRNGAYTIQNGNDVNYNATRYNYGNGYNTPSYSFNAPIAGVYHFTATLYTTGNAAGNAEQLTFRRFGVSGPLTIAGEHHHVLNSGSVVVSVSGSIQMAVGDGVCVYYVGAQVNVESDGTHSHFEGHLVFPT